MTVLRLFLCALLCVQIYAQAKYLIDRGFQSKRIGKARTRGWIVRERGLEEVNANRNIEGKV